MAVGTIDERGGSIARGAWELPATEPPADPAGRLTWAEEQRRAWMEIAQDAERWIEQLEQGRAFQNAQLERQAAELDDQRKRLTESQQRLQALQRNIDHLRARLSEVERSRSYRLAVWISSAARVSRASALLRLPLRVFRRFTRQTRHAKPSAV